MAFGNGIPVDELRKEARAVTEQAFRTTRGKAFLLVHELDVTTTEGTDTTKRTVDRRAPLLHAAMVVFPLKRRGVSQFDWIAVGRNEGNDVYLPHASVSRFHAFFRDMGSSIVLQDARSSNGTFVGDTRIPPHGDGPPMTVQAGLAIRFGDVPATYLSAEGLFAILTKLS